jgi:aryl-alcohol dehydrogenase-like predicted oxidoreductase
MEKRKFGRTGHMSSVAIFGAAALHATISQADANEALDLAFAAGVNHYDVAASYGSGMAETRLGPWLEKHRHEVFVGTKTGVRSYEGAWAEVNRSLALLRTNQLDLAQIHAVTTFEELDKATGPDGALKAMQRARDEGLTKFIGITGHDWRIANIHIEALSRFDFDTVLFPINPVLYANAEYRISVEKLLQICQDRNVGVQAIKSVANGPWGDQKRRYNTWYEPFDRQEKIQQGVNFTLSQPGVTGIPTAGDTTILPMVIKAVENFQPMSQSEQEALIAQSQELEPIFA